MTPTTTMTTTPRCPHCAEILPAHAALSPEDRDEYLRAHFGERAACRAAERRGRYTLFQPAGTTPGPFSVVGDPWDRSRTMVVGRATLPGALVGDPHVSPLVTDTDARLSCPGCEEGEHDPSRHRADARLLQQAAEMFDLLLRIEAQIGHANAVGWAELRADIHEVLGHALPFHPTGPTGMNRASDLTCAACKYVLPEGVVVPSFAACPRCETPEAFAATGESAHGQQMRPSNFAQGVDRK